MNRLGLVCVDLLGRFPNGALLEHLALLFDEVVLLVVSSLVTGVSVVGLSVMTSPPPGGIIVTSVLGDAPLVQNVTTPVK